MPRRTFHFVPASRITSVSYSWYNSGDKSNAVNYQWVNNIIYYGTQDSKIMKSIDFGNTFGAIKTTSTNKYLINASANGLNIMAWGGSGHTICSSDGGATWASRAAIAAAVLAGSSSDDMKFSLYSIANNVYKSSDTGVTYGSVSAVTCYNSCLGVSSTGQYQFFACYGRTVKYSSDYGATFTSNDTLGAKNWYGCAMSKNGQYIIVGVNAGRVYLSSNYGVDFAEIQPAGAVNKTWYSGSNISSTGEHMIVTAYSGRAYESTNYGVSWAEIQPTGNVDYIWGATAVYGNEFIIGAVQVGQNTYVYRYHVPKVWATSGNLNFGHGQINGGAGTLTAGLIVGGYTGTTNVNNCELFNGSTWSNSTGLGTARRLHNTIGTQSAAIVIAGYTSSALRPTEIWNGASWSAGNDIGTGNYYTTSFGNTSAAVKIGGNSASAPIRGSVLTELFNGSTWSNGNNLSTARNRSACCGTQTAGMTTGGGDATPWLLTTEKFDGTNWSAGVSLPGAKTGHGLVGTQTDALVWAGRESTAERQTTYVFNGTIWSSTSLCLAAQRYEFGHAGSTSGAWCAGGGDDGSLKSTEAFS